MKTLTAEETRYVETLNTVAGEITQRIVSDANYVHFFDMWKAFLGGFVCRELGKYTELDDDQKALIDEYTPEAIDKMLTKTVTKEVKVEVPVDKIVEKRVEVRVEVPVEKIVTKEVRVEVPVTTTNMPASSGGSSVTPRRRWANRARSAEKNRELLPSERVVMIERFNALQRLIDKDSTEMRDYAEYLNEVADQHGYARIFPSQLAGYWSVLCKRVCGIDGDVPTYIAGAIKFKKLPVGCPVPCATDAFKKEILENLMKEKAEAKEIAKYQAIYRGLMASNPSLNTQS